jgi:iron complex outermembrane recepter protein
MVKKTVISALFGLATSLALAPAFAQEGAIEEIVVTATKRAQTLQEVPIAVSVVTAEVLERAQIYDILDLQTVVPSLRVTQLQNAGQTNFIIRGFGNGANNPGIEPSVGVFIDGVYRSRTASAISDLPNLERIEVLRGPQSTLFGKNASAGVVSIITAAPNMDGLAGSASLVLGNYNQTIVKADINGPLSDTFGFSLSGSVNKRDGYFTNLENGSKINERDRWGVRGQLLWLPTDSLSFRFIADTDEIDEACCGVGNIVDGPTGGVVRAIGGELLGNDPFAREQYYDFDPVNVIKNSGASLQADWDFGNEMLLTSITAYREQERFEDSDVDYTSAAILGVANNTNIKTFTQEFRLSQSRDSVDWMLGAFYFDETVKYDTDLRFLDDTRPYFDILTGGALDGLEGALNIPAGSFFASGTTVAEDTGQDDRTISLFGQFDWQASDTITVTLGANYTKVDKDAFLRQSNGDVFSSLDFVGIGAGLIFQNLTGLPPTPPNIAANPVAWATAMALSTNPTFNPLLGLQPLQFLPPMVEFPNVVESGNSSDNKVTWTARIAWDAADNINFYASAGTGFKATSWNLSRDSRPFARDIADIEAAGLGQNNLVSGTRLAGPEESTVYELGFKGGWDSGYMNVAVFTQEIKGFQSNIFTGTGFSLANAGLQSTDGLEVDAVWNATDALQLTFSGTFLNPVYDSFAGAEGPDGSVDLSGTKPAGIHEVSLVTSAQYDFQIGANTGFLRGEYLYESDVQVVENVSALLASRSVNVINASAGITFGDRYDLLLWGRNLTDDNFLLSAFPSVLQTGSYSGYPSQPRTYGISLTARFD